MEYKSSAELKSIAREQLKGKYGVPIGAVVLTMLITFAASIITTVFIDYNSSTSMIIYYLISFIVSLLSAVLTLGLVKFFMNFCRNQKYQVGDIFWGFKNHPDKVIVCTILLSLLMVVCLIPEIVLLTVYLIMPSTITMIGVGVGILVSVILVVIVSLNYGMSSYILGDEPGISAIQALRKSRQMMNGHKGRLLYIGLSFIGWYILGIFTCFIAFLWIQPYIMCVNTYFYMDLKNEFRQNVIDELV